MRHHHRPRLVDFWCTHSGPHSRDLTPLIKSVSTGTSICHSLNQSVQVLVSAKVKSESSDSDLKIPQLPSFFPEKCLSVESNKTINFNVKNSKFEEHC